MALLILGNTVASSIKIATNESFYERHPMLKELDSCMNVPQILDNEYGGKREFNMPK